MLQDVEDLEDGKQLDDWMESKIAQCDQSITSVVGAISMMKLKKIWSM